MFIFKYLLFSLILLGSAVYGNVGKVSVYKGETWLERAHLQLALKAGLAIEEKDTVITGKDGHVQMAFIDKTVITLGNSTVFNVEEYLFDEINAKAKFSVGTGMFKAITGKIGKQVPENFSIRTKTAVIGIRGTIIRGKIGSDADTIMCEEGVISVTSLVNGEVYIIPAGKMIILSNDGSSVEIRDASPEEIKGLGMGEEFLLQSSSLRVSEVRSEDLKSLDLTPLSPFESPTSGLMNVVPNSAADALDRNIQTTKNQSDSESVSSNQPVIPDQPVQPVIPDQPVQPVIPDQPVQPVIPDQPAQPVIPDQPVQPVIPDQPVQPVIPDQPTQPFSPTHGPIFF